MIAGHRVPKRGQGILGAVRVAERSAGKCGKSEAGLQVSSAFSGLLVPLSHLKIAAVCVHISK